MDERIEKKLYNRRVGRTPLVRAKGLEKALDMEGLYLKLEGTNPSGHKCDRRSIYTVKQAKIRKAADLTIGTIGYMARSLSVLCQMHDIDFHPFIASGYPDVEVPEGGIKVKGTLEDAVKKSMEAAKANGWYDANSQMPQSLDDLAYSSISREIHSSLGLIPACISMSVSSGSMAYGIHAGFLEISVLEDAQRMPVMIGGTSRYGNAVLASYEKGADRVEHMVIDIPSMKSPMSPLFHSGGQDGSQVLDAFRDTGGGIFGFEREQLTATRTLLRRKEGIDCDLYSIAGLNALIKARENGLIGNGPNIVVLSTGRPDTVVRRMAGSEIDTHDLALTLDSWLGRFTDPIEEIEDAVQNAFDEGFVIGAYRGDDLSGIVILSRMHFDSFFPKYHLSYIASDPRSTGRGIGTSLMDKAIELTDGDFSLHVEPDNRKAINVYRKMGMDVKYLRMHFRKPKEEA
ncbi:MAG: pyridoxal-phosphate dependent enzyme [Candidatus Thermoplasmatota archaeon]|nr:pyridoxal-phosphate dependent enzyme [Candidatus Thermoplasmatota archaeon]